MTTTPDDRPSNAQGNAQDHAQTVNQAQPTQQPTQPGETSQTSQSSQPDPQSTRPLPHSEQPTTPLAHTQQPAQQSADPAAYTASQQQSHYPQTQQHSPAQRSPFYAQQGQQNQQPYGQAQQPVYQASPQQYRPQLGGQPPYEGALPLHQEPGHAESRGQHGHHEHSDQAEQPGGKRRSGLVAGLAIGALVGGLVGGGVAAVVAANISGQTVVQGPGGAVTLQNAETATDITGVAAVATPSVVTIDVAGASSAGSGSGVIYSEDGYIVTNAHVATLDGSAGGQTDIRVKLSDGRFFSGELVGTDPYADLAVIKIDAEDLPAIKTADSSELNVGDLAVAIGAPLNLSNTVTSGVVSALYRGISVGSPLIPEDQTPEEEAPDGQGEQPGFPWDFRFDNPEEGEEQAPQSSGGSVTLPVIQTDASINPGNSGGALLNGQGELIGINVAIASTAADSTSAGSVGLGFAIPVNLVTRVADSLIAGEQPSHGLLGASVADSSQDDDEDANFAGGLVVEAAQGSAAEQAGLRAGDVITAIDGVSATDGTSVSALVRMHEGGSEVTISYTRGGEPGEVTATLDKLEW